EPGPGPAPEPRRMRAVAVRVAGPGVRRLARGRPGRRRRRGLALRRRGLARRRRGLARRGPGRRLLLARPAGRPHRRLAPRRLAPRRLAPRRLAPRRLASGVLASGWLASGWPGGWLPLARRAGRPGGRLVRGGPRRRMIALICRLALAPWRRLAHGVPSNAARMATLPRQGTRRRPLRCTVMHSPASRRGAC